jgi:hypothetical protein
MMRRAVVLAGVVALIAILAWLRDPGWLAGMESGLGNWESLDGVAYRWTAGRASFFVPADVQEVRIRLRVPLRSGDWPVLVTLSIDGRPADRVQLSSDDWRHSRVRLPRPGSRRFRRIDIHVDRVRDGQRGVQVGAIELVR